MTQADPRLSAYREVWDRKPSLRAVYADYHRRIARACRPGPTLEVGGGSGRFKERSPEAISSDILFAPWLDLVADAQRLPFATQSLQNIVMLDVLHHLESPRSFFAEAARVLKPKGRVVLLDPAITPLSRIVYERFHPEPVDLAADPLGPAEPGRERDPYAANQAIPTLLFRRRPELFARAFPSLRVLETELLSLVVYPLCGGFRRWSLVPAFAVRPALALEELFRPLLGGAMAFRLLVVIERV